MAMLARTARIPCQDLARTPVLGPRTVEAGEAECACGPLSGGGGEHESYGSPSTGVLACPRMESLHS